jgi:hypothetical protein
MANTFQGLALSAYNAQSCVPSTVSSTGAHTGVLMSAVGTNVASAILTVGAVSSLVSLDVKLQWSTDNSTYSDITGATFTRVTAANTTEVIDFTLPVAASDTAALPIYVRAYSTISGTNAVMAVNIIGCRKFASTGSSFQNTSQTIN